MHEESKAIPESEGYKPAEENEHGKSTISNGRYWLLSGMIFFNEDKISQYISLRIAYPSHTCKRGIPASTYTYPHVCTC